MSDDIELKGIKAKSNGLVIPLAVLMMFVTQLVGSVWWAATITSKLDNVILNQGVQTQQINTNIARVETEAKKRSEDEEAARKELSQRIELYHLKLQTLREKLAASGYNLPD